MLYALSLMLATAPAGKPVYLECPLADTTGVPRLWQITLNEMADTADVTVADTPPQSAEATFYPDHVRLYLGNMRVDISRIDLKVTRYSNGEDRPPNFGQCAIAKSPPTKF